MGSTIYKVCDFVNQLFGTLITVSMSHFNIFPPTNFLRTAPEAIRARIGVRTGYDYRRITFKSIAKF